MNIEIFTDGGARGNPGPAAAGVVIVSDPNTKHYGYFLGEMTNNQAEYLALIIALEEVGRLQDLKAAKIIVRMDSELVVKQVTGEYRVKDLGLKPLYGVVLSLLKSLPVVEFVHIPREKNTAADKIVNRVLDVQNGFISIIKTT